MLATWHVLDGVISSARGVDKNFSNYYFFLKDIINASWHQLVSLNV